MPAQYIARKGQYQQRGGVELVESGNMPEFAQTDPHSFWVAADAHKPMTAPIPRYRSPFRVSLESLNARS